MPSPPQPNTAPSKGGGFNDRQKPRSPHDGIDSPGRCGNGRGGPSQQQLSKRPHSPRGRSRSISPRGGGSRHLSRHRRDGGSGGRHSSSIRKHRSRSYSRSQSPPVRDRGGRRPSLDIEDSRRSRSRSRSRSHRSRRGQREFERDRDRGGWDGDRDRIRRHPPDNMDNPRIEHPPRGGRRGDGPPFRDERPPHPHHDGPPHPPHREGGGDPQCRHDGEQVPGVSLLVRNISPDITSSDLQVAFGRIGQVRDVYIPRDFHSQQQKGFAFVEFGNPDQARDAREEMDRFLLKGRELEVVFAQERRKTPNEMRGRVVSSESSPGGDRDGGGFERSSSFDRYKRGKGR